RTNNGTRALATCDTSTPNTASITATLNQRIDPSSDGTKSQRTIATAPCREVRTAVSFGRPVRTARTAVTFGRSVRTTRTACQTSAGLCVRLAQLVRLRQTCAYD